MRIGEIRNIVKGAANASDQLVVHSEPLYNGQAYGVDGYAQLIEALKLISDMSWNDLDFDQVQAVIDKYGDEERYVELTDTEYANLGGYVSSLNNKFPIYLSVINSIVVDQEESFINIKLPVNIDSFTGLNSINARLDKLFKEFSVDGGIKFVGFDKGTDWYTVQIIGLATYAAFIACLKIGQEIMRFRKEYYNSETAKVEFETAKEIFTQTKDVPSFETYQDKRIEKLIDSKVNDAVEKLDLKGAKGKPELTNQLIIATTDLVQQLGEGVEFHLSLNPPEYAKETAGSLSIDYKKLRAIATPKEVKTIADSKDRAN